MKKKEIEEKALAISKIVEKNNNDPEQIRKKYKFWVFMIILWLLIIGLSLYSRYYIWVFFGIVFLAVSIKGILDNKKAYKLALEKKKHPNRKYL